MSRTFDGTNEFLGDASGAEVDPPMTIAFWTRPVTLAGDVMYSDFASTSVQYSVGENADGSVSFQYNSDSATSAAGLLVPGVSAHIAFTIPFFGVGNKECYVNGVNVASIPFGSFPSPTSWMAIGARGDGILATNATMGHCSVWNDVLTGDEIASLAAGASPTQVRRNSLVHYWPMNGTQPSLSISSDKNLDVLGAPIISSNISGIRKNRYFTGFNIPDPIGGTITELGGYRIHTFLLAQTGADFETFDTRTVEALIVAGGGGGGSFTGGGGGAGGMIVSPLVALAAGQYTVTVGAGGIGSPTLFDSGSPGGDSVFNTDTSTGGGGGEGFLTGTVNGGSGGGGGGFSVPGGPGTGIVGQGNGGGDNTTLGGGALGGAGGGGGAGAAGGDGGSGVMIGGTGGAGLQNAFSGTNLFYAGGGGGSCDAGAVGVGGSGIGGDGGTTPAQVPTAGAPNTGSGGGGVWYDNTAASGSSGIVIIRYLFP